MDNSIKLPENVVLVADAIHAAHEEISQVLLNHKQLNCQHSEYTYAHQEWNESCKYCQIDACMIRKCKECGKEYK